MTNTIIHNFVDTPTGCNQVPRPGKHIPVEGEVRYINGIRYIYSGGFLGLDQVIDPIDRFHNYSGRQGVKRPYGQNRANASLIR